MHNIYQHYRSEEFPFIDQCYDWIDRVSRQYVPVFTDFLTPREQTILREVSANHQEVLVSFHGAYSEAERQRALIHPYYETPNIEEFNLLVLEIDYPHKFCQLSHGQILGTVLSKGIERYLIGDIITDGHRWQIICDHKIGDYLIQQIDRISRAGVQLCSIDVEKVLEPTSKWQEKTVIAASLRLDTLISKVYNLSRQRSKELIDSKYVQVNFTVEERANFELGIADVISVRRYGRFWIHEVEGLTRKDNYRLNIRFLEK